MSTGDRAELFARAVALPAAERKAFLAELERSDPWLARELAELLAQDERGGPLARAASEKRSLIDSIVAEMTVEREPGHEPPSSRVLEQLATRTPSVSRYAVKGEVARGGMGAILEVWDEDLGRTLAMKVALAQARKATSDKAPPVDASALARFLEEAQVTGQLDHPGIVPVHELGLDPEGRVYFTMRLVKGRDLGEILELVRRGEEGWTQTRALGVLLKVCEAMSYAHSNGVVHRDLKPANVMVGRFGEVYVMDWGLARARGRRRARGAAERAPPRPAAGEPGSPGLLATQAGLVLGTPSYMPPEQAAGRLAEVDERSDVYAMGAMLYELLSGRMPYCGPGEHPEPFAVLARVLAAPPEALGVLAPGAPAELVAISEKAMSRDPGARYRDMGELGDDVRAFLEGRVVRAYETGAWAEARKWIERNRALAGAIAAGILALLAGLTASLILKAQSDRNASLAAEREQLASANETRALAGESHALREKERADHEADAARKRADEVLRLSALQKLDDLAAEADLLWPAYPERVEKYEAWLRRAEDLQAGLPDHERKLAELRARARPWTAEEQAEYRASNPKARELESARRHLEFHRRQRAAFETSDPGADPTLAEVGIDLASFPDAQALNEVAWPLVDPTRKEWGGEARGLVLARRALALASEAERADVRNTLAWALFAMGRFDEAVAEEEQALEEAGAARRTEFAGFLARLKKEIDGEIGAEGTEKTGAHVAEIEADVAALAQELATRADWTFDDDGDKWWHNQLEKLVGRLKGFAVAETGLFSEGTSVEQGWGVKKRLALALELRDAFAPEGEQARVWSEALPEIRASYPELALAPQLGLAPLGPDPESGLWEFAHLLSGASPIRGADGKLVLKEETGLVLVLLPGGTFRMGAQRSDPNGPNYDPEAERIEGPVHSVTLSPFFLSKYEMTQGQWLRFTGKNPSLYTSKTTFGGKKPNLLHPVEQMSWTAAGTVLGRLGLELPTEAQWEYAARAGTTSVRWTGDEKESLEGAANLADAYCKRNGAPPSWAVEEWLDDGNSVHAPVGSYRANAFGLHDVLGNVFEWCRDLYDDYRKRVRPGDGEREVGRFSDSRVFRGGAFSGTASLARSAHREFDAPDEAGNAIGVRPARSLTPWCSVPQLR